jgi:hypothetical protein
VDVANLTNESLDVSLFQGYVGYLGLLSGNPNRMFFGVDSWGNVCNQPNAPIPNATHSGKDMTGLL